MDKRDRALLFRQRITEALQRRNLNQSALAREAGLDRSTVSQLLGGEEPRLPTGQALAQIAGALQVSTDWLLGLSSHRGVASEILEQAVQVTTAAHHPVDAQVLRWMAEAAGTKTRHVPAGLPDIFKNDDVLTFEYEDTVRRTPEQAISDAQAQLSLLRRQDWDLEMAVPMQMVESFALGQAQWKGLDKDARIRQLDDMAELVERFYPSVRLYAFDQTSRYSVPFSVYGQQRVAIYIGQRYLAFTATRYVQEMARHFDDLVRAASVHGHEAADWLRDLARKAEA